MKIEFHIKEIVITSKQKSLIEKKIAKLKRYVKEEPMVVDVYLRDDTSSEKGGIDQFVELSAMIGGDKIFIQKKDDRLMRGFANAYKAFEGELRDLHEKRVDQSKQPGGDRFGKILKVLKIKK